MPFKSVSLGLSFGEVTPTSIEESSTAENYAIAFCAHERAHLSVLMAAPFPHPERRICPAGSCGR